MKRFFRRYPCTFFSVFPLAVLWLGLPAAGQALLSAPVVAKLYGLRGVSQSRVEPGESVWVWGVGLGKMEVELVQAAETEAGTNQPPSAGFVMQSPGQAAWYDKDYVRIVRFDRPGRYVLRLPKTTRRLAEGLHHELTVEVIPDVAREDLVFAPGLHVLKTPIVLRPATRVVAYGATFDAGGGPLFVMAPDCRIEGGTYRNFSQIGARGDGRDLLIRHATFVDGKLGHTWPLRGLELTECLFDRTSLNLHDATGVFVHRCRFTGVSPGHPIHVLKAEGLALVENLFDATDRGLVYQPRQGSVTNTFNYRNRFRNIDMVSNGNEVLLIEGGKYEFRHNLDMHSRITECSNSSVSLWGAWATNNLWVGLVHDGPAGIFCFPDGKGDGDTEQTGNVWVGCEIVGGLFFGPRTVDNLFIGGIVSASVRPTLNGRHIKRVMGHERGALVRSRGVGNRVIRCLLIPAAGQPTAERVLLIESEVHIHTGPHDGSISP
ncbi:MAG: hypothetical protein AAF800_01465 [Planctomycetota bacterium]